MFNKEVVIDLEFCETDFGTEILEISWCLLGDTNIKTQRFSIRGNVDIASLSIHGIVPDKKDPLFLDWWEENKEMFAKETIIAYGEEDLKVIRKNIKNKDSLDKVNYIDLYEQAVGFFDFRKETKKLIDKKLWSYRQAFIYTYIYNLSNKGDLSRFSLPNVHSSRSDVYMASEIAKYIKEKNQGEFLSQDECVFSYFPYGKYQGEKIGYIDSDELYWIYTHWTNMSSILERTLMQYI